jgi:MoaA/NifB/PqqE/SkfB family radical SAM enzyme
MLRSAKSYRRIGEVFKKDSFREALLKILNYFKASRIKEKYFYLKGIKTKFFAYRGPQVVQIDLTNDCNNNCLGCWCNSPLLGGEKKDKASLSNVLIDSLLEELSLLGTREIVLSGGGEPFMHPSILEVVRKIKLKKFLCHINTNFSLVDEGIIKELINLKVDYLTVSLWAATPQTYRIIHPNKTEGDFYKIRERLRLLNSLKSKSPKVKIYNVIFNLNYQEMEKMLGLAEELKADYIEYAVLDVVSGKTDALLPNSEELERIEELFRGILKRRNKIKIINFSHFLRRVSGADALRGEYEKNFIERLPCYSGWLFSRILANGNVIPCLKAHRFPVGNLYKQSFNSVWNGELMQEFRRKTISSRREESFFSLIGNGNDTKVGCYRICDDLPRNLNMYNKLNSWIYLEGIMAKLMR